MLFATTTDRKAKRRNSAGVLNSFVLRVLLYRAVRVLQIYFPIGCYSTYQSFRCGSVCQRWSRSYGASCCLWGTPRTPQPAEGTRGNMNELGRRRRLNISINDYRKVVGKISDWHVKNLLEGGIEGETHVRQQHIQYCLTYNIHLLFPCQNNSSVFSGVWIFIVDSYSRI